MTWERDNDRLVLEGLHQALAANHNGEIQVVKASSPATGGGAVNGVGFGSDSA